MPNIPCEKGILAFVCKKYFPLALENFKKWLIAIKYCENKLLMWTINSHAYDFVIETFSSYKIWPRLAFARMESFWHSRNAFSPKLIWSPVRACIKFGEKFIMPLITARLKSCSLIRIKINCASIYWCTIYPCICMNYIDLKKNRYKFDIKLLYFLFWR